MFTKRHEIIVGEKDVLAAINIFNKYQNFLVCGGSIDVWECDEGKYYMILRTTGKRWRKMIDEFEKIPTLRVRD
jgi:hypothetical protein